MSAFLKAAVVFAAVFILASGLAPAQNRVEVTGSVGYQFGGRVPTTDGVLEFSDDANLGFTLDVTVRKHAMVEISYSRKNGTAMFLPAAGGSEPPFGVTVEYLQLGGFYEGASAVVRPFGLMTLGLANVSPRDPGGENEMRFAAAAGAGVKLYLSPRIGVRLQGRLMFPFLSAGGVFMFGPDGTFVLIHSTVLVRGDLSAGLFVGF